LGEYKQRNSDFECWETLFKFNKNLFHRKALKNISKIETQLFEILQRVPRSKIFFALCKDKIFKYLLKKTLDQMESGEQIEFLYDIMGVNTSSDIATLCVLNEEIFEILGFAKKYKKKTKNSHKKIKLEDFVASRIAKLNRKNKKHKKKSIKIKRIFNENPTKK
jgi:TusA-related sulfurtransferase